MAASKNQKPTIEYPCPWAFKVIGREEAAVCRAIDQCLADCLADGADGAGGGAERGARITVGRTSSGGKYVSVNLELRVDSEQERNALFQALANRPEVRIVI